MNFRYITWSIVINYIEIFNNVKGNLIKLNSFDLSSKYAFEILSVISFNRNKLQSCKLGECPLKRSNSQTENIVDSKSKKEKKKKKKATTKLAGRGDHRSKSFRTLPLSFSPSPSRFAKRWNEPRNSFLPASNFISGPALLWSETT